MASGKEFIASLHRQEQRLRALDGVNVMIPATRRLLRGLPRGAGDVRHEGIVADSVAPGAKMPIATADVAARALHQRSLNGVVVRELLGPRDLIYTEVGEAIGQPDLHPHQDRRVLDRLRRSAGKNTV